MSDTRNDAVLFLCPGCGTAMEWDAAKHKFLCPSCGTETDDTEGDGIVSELPFTPEMLAKARVAVPTDRQVIYCQSCGAEITVDGAVTSVECSYCGSPHVLATKQEAGIPPEGILPFAVDKRGAKSIFLNWVGKRFWAPKALKRLYQQQEMNAVYRPYWTYDAQTQSNWRAEGGEVYYVTVGSGKNRHSERRVRWYPIRGNWNRVFDDIQVPADNGQNAIAAKVDSYDLHAVVPYAPAYLSGVGSTRYVLQPDAGFETAKQIMHSIILQEVRRNILRKYDEVRSLTATTNFSQVSFKQVLLPIWATGFIYRDKQYGCVINGQTGAIAGNYPKSGAKIAAAIGIGILVLAGLVWLLGYSGLLS